VGIRRNESGIAGRRARILGKAEGLVVVVAVTTAVGTVAVIVMVGLVMVDRRTQLQQRSWQKSLKVGQERHGG